MGVFSALQDVRHDIQKHCPPETLEWFDYAYNQICKWEGSRRWYPSITGMTYASLGCFLAMNALVSGIGALFAWLVLGGAAAVATVLWTSVVFFIAYLLGADTADDASRHHQ